jgi:hypothetical protein
MRFECDFEHRDTGEHRTISVTLTADEVEMSEAAPEPELYAMAYALRHAYGEMPEGFLHTEPPVAIRTN